MQIDAVFPTPLMKREDETLYDYCLSFSPAAPFFGVPYRFAEMFKPSALGDMTPKSMFAGFAAFSPARGEETIVEPPVEAEAIVEEVEEAVEAVAAPVEEAVEEVAEETVAAVEETVETVAEEAPEADLFSTPAAAAPATLYDAAPAMIDDLKLLKGVGPKLEAELNGLGIYTFAQIAEMTEANLEWLDEQISSVRGRPMRDDWAGQAKALAGL
ncbi:hypothetical protein ACQ5SO_02505 [Rhodovulum sp. DZ06]|uniref:hypothetical protein n=1 Tax=Rhodovulum sp. DZ06 TaxID=3425126 RepID=UPI003D334B3F